MTCLCSKRRYAAKKLSINGLTLASSRPFTPSRKSTGIPFGVTFSLFLLWRRRFPERLNVFCEESQERRVKSSMRLCQANAFF